MKHISQVVKEVQSLDHVLSEPSFWTEVSKRYADEALKAYKMKMLKRTQALGHCDRLDVIAAYDETLKEIK